MTQEQPPGAGAIFHPSPRLMLMFESLQEPLFRMLWIGTLFSTAAMQMNMLAKPWLAYNLTGSAVILGLVAGAQAIPQLTFSLVGGVVADRVRKRNLLLITQSCLGLVALTQAVLVHLGTIQIWHMVVLSAAQGTLFAFNMPARHAYVPELVGKRLLPNAIAIHSTGMNLNRVAAPALAGTLIAFNPTLAFYAIAVLYLGAVVSLRRLPAGKPAVINRESPLKDLSTGFRYVWNGPLLRLLMIMGFTASFLGMPFRQLLPVFQADVFLVGPSELGVMYMMVGAGALTSSLIMTSLARHPRVGLIQIAAGIGFGAGLIGLALSTSYHAGLAWLLWIGISSQGYMTINQVLLMTNVDRDLFGRVASIRMVAWSLSPAALLVLGYFIDILGVPPVVTIQGLVLAGFVLILALRHPRLWRSRGHREA